VLHEEDRTADSERALAALRLVERLGHRLPKKQLCAEIELTGLLLESSHDLSVIRRIARINRQALLWTNSCPPGFDDNGALAEGFEAQFGFVVANIKRVLGEAGATFRDLVKVNVLLTRASDVATMNVLYASAFGPAPYPARTTCVVQALPDPKMLIEIECVASLAKT
jgi:enamine deaminase RidA (YjgF/YER057c/UK114 family)